MVTAKQKTLKVTTTRVNLLRGNRMALGQRNSKMARYMKGSGWKIRSTDSDSI